jgi:hypothetical protein
MHRNACVTIQTTVPNKNWRLTPSVPAAHHENFVRHRLRFICTYCRKIAHQVAQTTKLGESVDVHRNIPAQIDALIFLNRDDPNRRTRIGT